MKGDLAAAADLLLQAIELAPGFASAWFTLGEIREQLGEREAAISAFRRAQVADPGDRHGAGLRLMLLGAEPLSAMPPAYVRALFDQYAPRFEAALVDDLGYRGPALLFKAVLSVRASIRKPAFFRRHRLRLRHRLAATAFGPARSIISPALTHIAAHDRYRRARPGLVGDLEVADMLAGLKGRPDASAELILAADAMVYVADLVPVLAEARRVLAAGGLLPTTKPIAAMASLSGQGCVMPMARPMRASIAEATLAVAVRGFVGPARGYNTGAGPAVVATKA